MTDIETAESWEEAKRIASVIGPIPSSFSSCVRFLRADFSQHQNQLSGNSKFTLGRLLKSPSFSAPLYYCASTFRPDAIAGNQGASQTSLVKVFAPDEASVLISVLYLYRKIRKGCDPEQWNFIAKTISTNADLGGFVGMSIPAIGFATGVLAGCMRQLAFGILLGLDKKNFTTYRQGLKRARSSANVEEEFRIWGCSHGQIASILSQPVGLGADVGAGLTKGYAADLGPRGTFSDEAAAIHAATLWIDSLSLTGKPPAVVREVKYYPLAKNLEQLLEQADRVVSGGSQFDWLNKGKSDFANRPQIAAAIPVIGQEPIEAPPSTDLPVFTKEDISRLEEE